MPEARQHARKAFDDPSAPLQDRIRSGQILAQLERHIYQDLGRAREVTGQLLSLDPADPDSWLQAVALERDLGHWQRAADLAMERARLEHENPSDQHDLHIAFAEITLQEALRQARRRVQQGGNFTVLGDRPVRAVSLLEKVLAVDPSRVSSWLTLYRLALLSGDGARALTAWSRYLAVEESGDGKTMLIDRSEMRLRQVLPQWSGGELDEDERVELARGLLDAWTFDVAAIVANTLPPTRLQQEPRLRDGLAYDAFLQDLEGMCSELYRKSLVSGESRGHEAAFRSRLDRRLEALWNELAWPAATPRFARAKLLGELKKRFGTEVRQGSANGFYSLTWGHAVIAYDLTVEQYGHRAQLRFTSLDFLVTTGTKAFLRETLTGGVGGWARTAQDIFQVRPGYASGPHTAWRKVTDPRERRRTEERLDQERLKDERIARLEPISTPRGLGIRLMQKAQDDLLARLQEKGLRGDALARAYVLEYERLNFQHSIVAHEGRHAIDKRLSVAGSLEYRAKLSELAFSEHPFLPLAVIVLSGIQDTPHGRAAETLVRGLVSWMESHRQDVAGFDPKQPTVLQLDRLSAEQLRMIARSLDPLAPRS